MKSRPRLIVSAVIAIVVASLARQWLVSQRPRLTLSISQLASSSEPLANSSTATTAATPDGKKQLQREDRVESIREAIEQTNVPLAFWGKVLDQNQRPVAGVRVQYSYSTEHGNNTGAAWGEQRIHKSSITSDIAGSFSVNGVSGHILTIESLTKEGFSYNPRGARSYNYYGDTPSGKFEPDPGSPITFVMVDRSCAEPLISYGGSFGKTLRLPGNGEPVRWSLWKGEPNATGELQIMFKREPVILARVGTPSTWSAKLEIVDGGIVEALPDEPFYQAPVDGYFAVLEYPKTEQKRGIPARSFYLKTADSRYGRIELHLYPGDEGPTARCLIKGVMNPSGSRILEPIP
jgi:hypothetical protein